MAEGHLVSQAARIVGIRVIRIHGFNAFVLMSMMISLSVVNRAFDRAGIICGHFGKNKVCRRRQWQKYVYDGCVPLKQKLFASSVSLSLLFPLGVEEEEVLETRSGSQERGKEGGRRWKKAGASKLVPFNHFQDETREKKVFSLHWRMTQLRTKAWLEKGEGSHEKS